MTSTLCVDGVTLSIFVLPYIASVQRYLTLDREMMVTVFSDRLPSMKSNLSGWRNSHIMFTKHSRMIISIPRPC